jgi:multidrug efflux system membrane fusion protein
MRGIHSVGVALLFISLTSAACAVGGQAETTTPAGSGEHGGRGGGSGDAVPVSVSKAIQKAVPIEVKVIGSVEPSSTVAIRAQVTGELTSVAFKEGDDVREGQVLFELDRRPLEAALKQAEANLQRDTAQAANAEAQAKRAQELAERGIATREQLETAKSTANAMDATLAADRAAVDNARVQLQYATIRAPISGRTGQLMVHPGNLVRANDTTALVVINRISPVNVSFAVPEAQLPMVREYLSRGEVRVQAASPSGEEGPSEGHITFVDNSVDPTTGTIRMKGSFTNADHRLWPGQFVNVVIRLATDPNAIVVPSVAVQLGQDGSYVFVVKPDQTAELRTVEVGRINGDETIISKGVSPGDTVVTDGQLRLVSGSRVTLKPEVGRGAGA